MTIPSSGAFFTTYEALKFTINENIPPNSTLYIPQPAIHGVASAGAELVSCAILTPAEVLKQNAQMVKREGYGKGKSPTIQVLQNFKRNPARLWRGYTALAARNLPFTAMQFPMFEHLKEFFLAKRKAAKGGQPVDGILERASITAVSGGLAGSLAAWITTPIDVVKTRIMLAAGDKSSVGEAGSPSDILKKGLGGSRKSGFTVAAEIFRNEGYRGLFTGAALRSIWTMLGSGLYLGVYEGGRFYLEDSRKQREGDSLMEKTKDWSKVKVGIGSSRSQDVVKKSAWQDD